MKSNSEKMLGYAVLKYEILLLGRMIKYVENIYITIGCDAVAFEGHEDYEDVSGDFMFSDRITGLMEARKELDLAELPFKLPRMLLAGRRTMLKKRLKTSAVSLNCVNQRARMLSVQFIDVRWVEESQIQREARLDRVSACSLSAWIQSRTTALGGGQRT